MREISADINLFVEELCHREQRLACLLRVTGRIHGFT